MDRGLMLYDADCGFCTRTAERVHLLGVDVDRASIQETDLAAYAIPEDRALREMPFVHADGGVDYGHRAWVAILATGPWPDRLLARVLGSRALAPVASRAYRWVSERRHLMPGGTPSCSLESRPGQATTR